MAKSNARDDIKLTSVDDLFSTEESRTDAQREKVVDIRKINAQKFEAAFYSNPDLRSIKPLEQQKTINLTGLIEQL